MKHIIFITIVLVVFMAACSVLAKAEEKDILTKPFTEKEILIYIDMAAKVREINATICDIAENQKTVRKLEKSFKLPRLRYDAINERISWTAFPEAYANIYKLHNHNPINSEEKALLAKYSETLIGVWQQANLEEPFTADEINNFFTATVAIINKFEQLKNQLEPGKQQPYTDWQCEISLANGLKGRRYMALNRRIERAVVVAEGQNISSLGAAFTSDPTPEELKLAKKYRKQLRETLNKYYAADNVYRNSQLKLPYTLDPSNLKK